MPINRNSICSIIVSTGLHEYLECGALLFGFAALLCFIYGQVMVLLGEEQTADAPEGRHPGSHPQDRDLRFPRGCHPIDSMALRNSFFVCVFVRVCWRLLTIANIVLA